MDALDLLTADHNRVRGMFGRFKQAKESDQYDRMAELSETIIEELQIHTEIEERVFYPGVKKINSEIAETIAEGMEEHHVVDMMIEEIQQLKPSDEAFAAKMTVLIENVEHHAKEEEEDLFPDVRKAIDADSLTSMGEEMEELKRSMGAPTLADKIDLTKEQLDEMARDQEIPNRSTMSKEELAATVAPQ